MVEGTPVAAGFGMAALSARTGCHSETIRYYERIGLMPQPARRANGTRVYEESHLQRLLFIMRARELGFPIDGVRDLLRLAERGGSVCSEVRAMTVAHLASVQRRLAEITSVEQRLSAMLASDAGDASLGDPIIDALRAAPAPNSPPAP